MKLLLVNCLFIFNIGLVYSCARTADTGVTTTAASTGCNSCTAGQIQLLPDPDDPVNGHAPDPPTLGPLQGGCSTLIINCNPINNNPQSLLTFQNGLGGPVAGAPSTATLVCNNQGQWIYTLGGISTAITQAFCLG